MEYFDYGSESQDDRDQSISEFNVEEFLEQSQQREKRRLERQLERIQVGLEDRDHIHEEAIEELESKRDWYVERLEKLYQRRTGKQGRRERLKDRIKRFYAEIREEERSNWQDQQKLKEQRREIRRRLDELTSSEEIPHLL